MHVHVRAVPRAHSFIDHVIDFDNDDHYDDTGIENQQ